MLRLLSSPFDAPVLCFPLSPYVSRRLFDWFGELCLIQSRRGTRAHQLPQAKEYLPAHSLRRIIALQNELVKGTNPAPVRGPTTTNGTANSRQPQTQRTLLSANFGNPLQSGANLLGRNLLNAGDQLRNLIVPDALAAIVSAPAWIPGMGGRRNDAEMDGGKKRQKLRSELDNMLASSCPLCESVVVGLDKPFVKDGEVDTTWTL